MPNEIAITTGCQCCQSTRSAGADSRHAEDLLGDDRAAEESGICSAMMVMTGIMALRIAWRDDHRLLRSPLARAVRT